MCGAHRRVSDRSASAERDSSKQALRSVSACARIHPRGSSSPVASVGGVARQHRSDRHNSFERRRLVPQLRRAHCGGAEAVSCCRNCLSRIRSALAGAGRASIRRTRLGAGGRRYRLGAADAPRRRLALRAEARPDRVCGAWQSAHGRLRRYGARNPQALLITCMNSRIGASPHASMYLAMA